MLYGREAVLPPDRTLQVIRTGVPNEDQYLQSLDIGIKKMYSIVNENIEKAAQRNKAYYDRLHRIVSYNIGDKVLVYYPTRFKGLSEKLLNQFHGPFEIVKCHSNGVNYEVQGIRNGKKLVIDCVHVSRLKPYYDRERLISKFEKLADEYPTSVSSGSESEGQIIPSESPTDSEGTVINTDQSATEEYDYMDEVHPHSRVVDPPQNETVGEATATSIMPPLLRRSQRIRQPRKMLDLLSYYLIMCVCLFGTVSSSFHKINPIVWRKSDKPVITGINRILINARLSSPCDVFLDQSFIPYKNEELKNWCDNEFRISFIEPLRKFCKNPYHMPKSEIVLKRQKRLAFLAVGIIAVIAIAITTTVGLSTHAILQNKGIKEEIESIQAKQQELIERLANLEENHLRVKKIVALLQTQIEGIGSQVKGLTESLKLLQNSLPSFMIYVSNIAARLALTRDKITDISRKWKSNVVDEKILEIFNFTNPCLPDCDLRYAEPRDCSLNEEKQLVSMIFDIKNTPKDVILMEADPFTLYSIKTNSSVVCAKRYSGAKTVVYSSKSDCVVSLPTSEAAQNLVVVPNLSSCRRQMPANITAKYWKANSCENKHKLVIEDIVQIKQIADNNYIYCESFDINVYNRSLSCPPFVFSLPVTAGFTIDALHYEAKEVIVESEIDLITPISQRINFHIFPQIHNFDFESLALEVRQDLKDMKIDPMKGITDSHSSLRFIDFVYLIVGSLMLLAAFIYFARKNCIYLFRSRESEPNPVQETDLDMEEIPEKSSSKVVNTARKPERSRTKHTLLLASFLFLLTCAECKPSDDVIILNFHFDIPCTYLTKRNFSLFEISWCGKKFNETFLEPISNFCKTPAIVASFNRSLFTKESNKSKRDLHFAVLNTALSSIVPTINNEWKKLDMASLAASLMIIKSSITKMGTKWAKGEIDEHFVDSQHISLHLPNNNLISQYEPLAI
jgi:hypothetical protein